MKPFNLTTLIPAIFIGFSSSIALAQEFEAESMTVAANSLISEDLLQGDHYTIDDTVTVQGYLNQYTVHSDYGEFAAVGDRALRKLLGEIIAIEQLKKTTTASASAGAAADAVANTADSLAALATDPVGTVNNLSAGVSRFFKRTSKTVNDVSEKAVQAAKQQSNGDSQASGDMASEVTTQLASSYLGIGKAQREIAKELNVDPYSKNPVLQAELARVAKVYGSVGKLTHLLIPVPSIVSAATSVSDLVWNLSPTDLFIMNKEKLTALGFDAVLIDNFVESKFYTPTEQTFLVSFIEALDQASDREVLLETAILAETEIEAGYFLYGTEFYAKYDAKISKITKIVSSGAIPIVITAQGDGLVFAALDRLLWTEEVAQAVEEVEQRMADNSTTGNNLLWIEGEVSKLATESLSKLGWKYQSKGMESLN